MAVEYRQSYFEEIIDQREKFGDLVKNNFPWLSEEESEQVKASLAYEGDIHLQVWPDVATVWLNEEPDVSDHILPESVLEYAQHRINSLKSYATSETSASLSFLDEVAIKLANERISKCRVVDMQKRRRDEESWVNILKKHLAKLQSDEWGVAIIGSAHVRSEFFLSSLKAAGFSVSSLFSDVQPFCSVTS